MLKNHKSSQLPDKMSQRLVHVEAQRTFVTPRGRKFVPREPKKFEMSLGEDEDMYASLTDKIGAHFPRLQGQYQILYKGIDDELHTISDKTSFDMNLQASKDDKVAIFVQGDMAPGKCQAQNKHTPQCSNCSGQIVGVRTKCLQCEEYNLCTQCEAQGIHANHVMVQCERPRFFNFGLQRFTDVIPTLCEQQIQNSSDIGNLPRLDAKTVRQFWMSQRKLNKAEGDNKPNQSAKGPHKPLKDIWRQFLVSLSTEGQKPVQEGPVKGGQMKWMKIQMQKVACGNCKTNIIGKRAKCLECSDFFLCEDCDSKGVHSIHVMVQCDRPRFFFFALPKFGEAIAELCAEQKEKHAGAEKMPRLDAKDVRQFWQSKRKENNKEKNKMDKENYGRRQRQQEGASVNDTKCEEGNEKPEPMDFESQSPMKSTETSMETCEEGSSPNVDGRNIQQLKRQWMQKCRQAWRERMQNSARNSSQADGGRPLNFAFWRPYMRQCWDLWQEIKLGVDQPQGGCCVARRQWIQACWRLWREEAEKQMQSSQEKEGDKSQSQTEQNSRCPGPFPGYHNMMIRSWRLMQDQQKSRQKPLTPVDIRLEEQQEQSARTVEPTGESQIGPKMAKQMLKQIWVNGCREIWWKLVRKCLDGVSDEAAVQKMTQLDVMKVMASQQKIRMYMRECWKLWIQLSQQAGMTVNKDTHDQQKDAADKPGKPKQMWLKDVTPVWMNAVTKQTETEKSSSKVMWEKRPFEGWRQLIMKSWDKITEHSMDPVCGKQITKEMHGDFIKNLSEAHEQFIGKKMKKMSLLERSLSDAMRPLEATHFDENKNVLTAQERKELQANLMEQFWCQWEQRKESKNPRKESGGRCQHRRRWRLGTQNTAQEAGEPPMECERGIQQTESTCPRLKITLRMKSKPTSPQ